MLRRRDELAVTVTGGLRVVVQDAGRGDAQCLRLLDRIVVVLCLQRRRRRSGGRAPREWVVPGRAGTVHQRGGDERPVQLRAAREHDGGERREDGPLPRDPASDLHRRRRGEVPQLVRAERLDAGGALSGSWTYWEPSQNWIAAVGNRAEEYDGPVTTTIINDAEGPGS